MSLENSQFSYQPAFVFSQPSDRERECKGKTRWKGSTFHRQENFPAGANCKAKLFLFNHVLSNTGLTKSLLWSLLTQLGVLSCISFSFSSAWPLHLNQMWVSTFAPAVNYLLFPIGHILQSLELLLKVILKYLSMYFRPWFPFSITCAGGCSFLLPVLSSWTSSSHYLPDLAVTLVGPITIS